MNFLNVSYIAVGGKTLKWIDSFLCDRQQRVMVNGVKSDWAPVLSGVCTKANRTHGFLRRNLAACPLDVKESAYKGLVRPILKYGSSVWDPKAYFFKMNLRKFRKEQLDL